MAIKNASDIEPTLFLGLGGAGGKVLGRLRRIYDQEFGRAGGTDSPVQFLLLDADDFEKLDEAVKGSLSERDEFLPISHFNPRHYIDQHRRDPHSDLRRWFDPNTRPLLEDAFIRDGASRLRMLGRLCLHRSYYEVQKALAEKINRARSARALVDGGGTVHRSERPIRVILVSSSCGGTGSGIFLDMVYMINRLIRDAGATPDVISFLFLPFWFIDANRAVDTELVPYFQANAWAFFEELNYVLLHPERLANIALDPGRRQGTAPGLQGQDYEPLKTVFLVDSVIPNVGRFQDANDWNDYIAQSIFHVFLAPEEGNLQSVYSNVKTKLAETDRRMGLKKRFAAIGYADLRHPGEALRREMARCAAAGCLRGYLDAPPDAAQVRREADALAQQLEDAIRAVEQRVDDLPAPQLEPEAFTRREGGVRKARLGDLGALRHSVDQEVAAFNARVPDDAAVEEAVAMAQRMMGPRLELPLGLAGERRLLDEVFGRFTAQSGDGAGPAELRVDAGSLEGMAEIDAELRKVAGWMGGGPSDDPGKYLPYLERINARLRELAQDFKAQRARALRARLASRIAGRESGGAWVVGGTTTPTVLGAQRQRLEHAAALLAQAAALGQPAGPGKGDAARHTSLTTRYYPDSADAGAAWRSLAPRIDARVRTEADKRVRGLARALAAGGAPDDPAALLAQVEADLDPALDQSAQVLDELQAEIGTLRAQAAAGDRAVLARLDALEKLLGNLYSLSTPCCGIDPARLTPGETIPQVFIAASRLKEGELQTRLGLPTQPGIIDTDGTQLSLTQVLYAFPSHVVPGMEALRRAYETRDRDRSYPHVTEEWNRNDLRVSRPEELTDEEVLQFARVRAISDLLARPAEAASANGKAGGNGTDPLWRFGLRVTAGWNGEDAPWLLRYEKDDRDGQYHLRARGIDPVPGHHRVWKIVGTAEDLEALDLLENMRRYLASPVRDSHEKLLASDIHELECGEQGPVFAGAYQQYADQLEAIASWHRGHGRQDEERLHLRVAGLLRQYARGLDAREVPVP